MSLIFSEEDADLYQNHKWRFDRGGYMRTNIKIKKRTYQTIFAHHIVCERAFGRRPDWSKREVCDHINRNKLDNRRENLRITCIRTNSRNIERVNRDNGATFHKKSNRWQSQATVYGTTYYIGLFSTKQLAVDAKVKFVNQFLKLQPE